MVRPQAAFDDGGGVTPIIHRLAHLAADESGISRQAIFAGKKSRAIAWPRFATMKVAHENGRSLSQIARCLRLKDHSSVFYGVQRAAELEAAIPAFAALLSRLRAEAAR